MPAFLVLMKKYRHWIFFIVSLCLGAMIGWMDSRPNWDDTGVTVFLVLGVSALFGFLNPKRPWMWALSVGIWIPIWNVLLNNTYGSSFALVFAFIGAYVGAYGRKLLLSRF